MANVFTNGLVRDVGTSPVNIYTAPANKKSIVIELDVCNKTNAAIQVDTYITSAGNDFYLVKNAPIPAGGTLQLISGQKIVLKANEILKVVSNTATSVDAVASILEDV
jgi:hypothetical protein